MRFVVERRPRSNPPPRRRHPSAQLELRGIDAPRRGRRETIPGPAFAPRRWPALPAELDLGSYDTFIVAFSGGKDSLACLLYLLLLGIPPERIELWHHDVDGREGSTLMDWPCTRDYCRAVAEAFGVPIYYSWREGGFEREMDRVDSATGRVVFETPTGLAYGGLGDAGPKGTRGGLFPQVSPDLTVRWCSAALKIGVCDAALRGQTRFAGRRTLLVTGERAEESSGRAKYKELEPHRADLRGGRKPRHIDQWRAVHRWSEADVWAIIERYRVNPHPAYRLGWSRVSCALCIFGSPAQWASARAIMPGRWAAFGAKERASGKTVKRLLNVDAFADKGRPLTMAPADIRAALSTTFDEPVILRHWTLPAGAFGEDTAGPT